MGEFKIKSARFHPTYHFYEVQFGHSSFNIRDRNKNGYIYDDSHQQQFSSLTAEQRARLQVTIEEFRFERLPALLRRAKRHAHNVKDSQWTYSPIPPCTFKGKAKSFWFQEKQKVGRGRREVQTDVKILDRDNNGEADRLEMKISGIKGLSVCFILNEGREYNVLEARSCHLNIRSSAPWLSMFYLLLTLLRKDKTTGLWSSSGEAEGDMYIVKTPDRDNDGQVDRLEILIATCEQLSVVLSTDRQLVYDETLAEPCIVNIQGFVPWLSMFDFLFGG